MKVYHELNPDSVESIMANGLKRASRGEKGADSLIMKADYYLDERCPRQLKRAGVSRDDNIYAYYEAKGSIVNITDGSLVSTKQFIANSSKKVLEINVDRKRCYVSDLDTYDALKAALGNHEKSDKLEKLASSYWRKLVSLDNYESNSIRRPEIMITYDIAATDLRVVN